MPFLPPNQQCQSTEGKTDTKKQLKTPPRLSVGDDDKCDNVSIHRRMAPTADPMTPEITCQQKSSTLYNHLTASFLAQPG